MSQHDEELFNAIDKMINERTFSLEAVEAVKKMRTQLKEALDDVASSEASCDDYKEKWNTSKQAYDQSDRLLRDYEAREKSLVERENKITRLECEVDKHMAVGNAYANCFEQAFRNVTVRRSANKAMMGRGYGSDAGDSPFTAPEDSTTKEE